MAKLQDDETILHVDDDGFLVNEEDWNETVAQAFAQQQGITVLNEEQMAIIKFLRDYYHKFHAFPILNYVCKNIHAPRECVNEQFINPMTAWKIAGLPNPGNIHFVTVDGRHYIMEECG